MVIVALAPVRRAVDRKAVLATPHCGSPRAPRWFLCVWLFDLEDHLIGSPGGRL
jgi:hypothetical protein